MLVKYDHKWITIASFKRSYWHMFAQLLNRHCTGLANRMLSILNIDVFEHNQLCLSCFSAGS
ncbi:hypothetical protein AEQ67_18525 [Pseudomonas sp. RIT-PI-q]|nr:hypothetical protein AEQ67_18525 [Pseudomonas sp. RIT-PI-q]